MQRPFAGSLSAVLAKLKLVLEFAYFASCRLPVFLLDVSGESLGRLTNAIDTLWKVLLIFQFEQNFLVDFRSNHGPAGSFPILIFSLRQRFVESIFRFEFLVLKYLRISSIFLSFRSTPFGLVFPHVSKKYVFFSVVKASVNFFSKNAWNCPYPSWPVRQPNWS